MEQELNDVELQSGADASGVALRPSTKFFGFICGSFTFFLLLLTLLEILAYYSHPLQNAIAHGDVDALKRAVAKGGNVNAEDEYGRSMLNRAIMYGRSNRMLMFTNPEARFPTIHSMLEVLLDAGAKVNVEDSYNDLPLCLAIRCADINAVKLLIEKGAEVNKWDGRGNTPLGYAEDAQLQEIISLLKEKGATW